MSPADHRLPSRDGAAKVPTTSSREENALADLLQSVRAYHALRAPSLIITLFGDSVSQHGGRVWLSSLIQVLQPLGLSEGVVRTSVYRLIRDGWLHVYKIGRRSDCALTDLGLNRFVKASHRIYAANQPDWNGKWTLVTPVKVPADKRELFGKILLWQGYGRMDRALYAHPMSDHRSLDEALQEMGLADSVIVWESASCLSESRAVLRELVQKKWNIPALEKDYRHFLLCFQDLPNRLRSARRARVSAAWCFQVRTLLIHEYRRILLKDPGLPMELLPVDWPGAAVQRLTEELYRHLAPKALDYILEHLKSSEGRPPPPPASYFQRFGGI